MARSAQGGHLVRSGHAIRRRGAGGRPMLHALAMARVTTEPLGEMRMRLKIADLLRMARSAKLMRLLRKQRRGIQREQQILHARRTRLRSIEASVGLPAS